MAYQVSVKQQLTVNKQLIGSKILSFHLKHLYFAHYKSIDGLFSICKQSAGSKQTADHVYNSKILL